MVPRAASEVPAPKTTVFPLKRSRSLALPPEVWQGLPIANLPANFDLPALQLNAANPLPRHVAQPTVERTTVKRERDESVEERLRSTALYEAPDNKQSGRPSKKAKRQSQATAAITPDDASFISAVEMSPARGERLTGTGEYELVRELWFGIQARNDRQAKAIAARESMQVEQLDDAWTLDESRQLCLGRIGAMGLEA